MKFQYYPKHGHCRETNNYRCRSMPVVPRIATIFAPALRTAFFMKYLEKHDFKADIFCYTGKGSPLGKCQKFLPFFGSTVRHRLFLAHREKHNYESNAILHELQQNMIVCINTYSHSGGFSYTILLIINHFTFLYNFSAHCSFDVH